MAVWGVCDPGREVEVYEKGIFLSHQNIGCP